MCSMNRNSFLRPLKNKGFKEATVTKIGLYDIVKSTTLESNKSLVGMSGRNVARQASRPTNLATFPIQSPTRLSTSRISSGVAPALCADQGRSQSIFVSTAQLGAPARHRIPIGGPP